MKRKTNGIYKKKRQIRKVIERKIPVYLNVDETSRNISFSAYEEASHCCSPSKYERPFPGQHYVEYEKSTKSITGVLQYF